MCKYETALLTFLAFGCSEVPKLLNERSAITLLNPKSFTNSAFKMVIFANSISVGSIFKVVSDKKSGPESVSIIFVAAIRVFFLLLLIIFKTGLITAA